MEEKRSEAEKEFGRLLKEMLDAHPEQLDFWKPLYPYEVPPPETFMIGKPGRARRRKQIKRAVIVGAVAVLVAGLFLVGGYLHGKREKAFSEGPLAQVMRYGNESLITSGNGLVVVGGGVDPDKEGSTVTYSIEADIEMAKKRMPELLIPEYVPEGYEFFDLEISKYMSGRWEYRYTYFRKDHQLMIRQERGGDVEVIGAEDAEAKKVIEGMK